MKNKIMVYTGENRTDGPIKGRKYRVIDLINHSDFIEQTGCVREWQGAALLDAFGNRYYCDSQFLRTTREFVDYLTDAAQRISLRQAALNKELNEVKSLLKQLEIGDIEIQ